MSNLWLIAPATSIIALIWAHIFYKSIMKKSEGNEKMVKIASYVREGAYSYLKQQYKVVGIFFIITTFILIILSFVLKYQNTIISVAFISGGIFSALAGFWNENRNKFFSENCERSNKFFKQCP